MSFNQTYTEIMTNIKRLYDKYEDRSMQMAEDKRVKTGGKIDKSENQFLDNLGTIQKQMTKLSIDMRKEEKGANNEFKESIMIVQACLRDIRQILRKKPLNFKVNKDIREMIQDTQMAITQVRKDLSGVKNTKTLCCGTDGGKKFKTPMNFFKIIAAKWRIINSFQAKDSVQTFVSPPFKESQFSFIQQILRKKWPQQAQQKVEVVEKEIVREVIREVNTGKPSILNTANQYIFGINREQNYSQGFDIYHNEADKNNNGQACAFLGKAYEQGIFLPKDIKKSHSYYQKSYNSGDNYGSYRYAIALIKGKFNQQALPDEQQKNQVEKAHSVLTKIATKESPSAQAITELGELYEYGFFLQDAKRLFKVKQDLKKSINYYEKGRTLKMARASNNLGVLLMNDRDKAPGQSQISDPAIDNKIMTYLTESRDQGFVQAYYNLGVIYSQPGTHHNPELALHTFYQGGYCGDHKCRIKYAYELMNQTSIMKQQYEDHYRLAAHWLENIIGEFYYHQQDYSEADSRSNKKEKAEASFYLGLMYEHGFGVEKSPKRGFNYFIESAELDYPAAKNKIGDCYFSGYGIKQDKQLAVGCYLEAAELFDSDSMVNLGTIYLNGVKDLIERSYNKAYKYFISANQLDNSDAKIHLSFMYRNGLGVEPSEQIAKELLEQAAELKNATALYMLKEYGSFNSRILFEHLENQCFPEPKNKINLKENVPIMSAYRQ